MNEPNPDELQPHGMSDKDVERQVKNYVVMTDLEKLEPEKLDWQPMKEPESDG